MIPIRPAKGPLVIWTSSPAFNVDRPTQATCVPALEFKKEIPSLVNFINCLTGNICPMILSDLARIRFKRKIWLKAKRNCPVILIVESPICGLFECMDSSQVKTPCCRVKCSLFTCIRAAQITSKKPVATHAMAICREVSIIN